MAPMRKTASESPARIKPRQLELSFHAATRKDLVPFLENYLMAAHALLGPALAELSVALVGDARMSKLHKQFMDVEGPTDVLTFPMDFDVRGRPVAGDVVVCVPEAARQARIRGTKLEREVLLYALHGMLHLSGFDDRTDSAYRRMHRKEDQLLISLGLGPVFKAAVSASAKPGQRETVARASSRKPVKPAAPKRRRGSANESVGV